MTGRIALAFVVLVSLLPALLPAPSLAQDGRARAVVLRFEGPRAEQARRAAVSGLETQYELVDESALIDTAARIAVDVSTPEGMAAVVEHLGVTLVIGGFVEGSGRRATTTVWVMDVRGNELTRRQTVGPTGRGAAQEIATAASQAAAEGMAVLHPPQPDVPPPVGDPPIDDGGGFSDEEPPGRDEPVDVEGRWNQPLLRALVGLRIRNRTIAVTPDVDRDQFVADFYPDLQLEVQLRPLSRDPGPLRGLYFALTAGVSVGMTYVQNDGDTPSMTSYNFEIDAGYGLVLAELVELVFSIGLGIDGFDLADYEPPAGTFRDFPSTLYSFFRPAVQGRFRLLPDHLLLAEVGLGGRLVWDVGPLQDPSRFAPEGVGAGGVDFFLGLAGIIEPGFSWAARFSYTTYLIGFNGGVDESRAQDEALQIWLMVGWAF